MSGAGADDPANFAAALAQAQAAVAAMADEYIGWVTADLVRLDEAVAAIDPANPPAGLKAAHGVAHDIKGQGATFGYKLVTDIAAMLCRYLQHHAETGSYDPEVIEAHVQALKTVVENRVKGDAGALGQEILATLQEVGGPA
ncbi:Hpt domain-containing protein [Ferrovibrio sp.]|uniref:Hpt domain-containing protein n=1 Tax=Ferrovibrio sp. TaxID=1917215 RepID=UPI0025B83047|nr:Hpt domain-containing protein [Ferrovibrio sp.]MBX3453199.1 Hpt domain-containing protein [Ferrovibrio sp.]